MPSKPFRVILSGHALMKHFDPERDEVFFFERSFDEPKELEVALKEYRRSRPELGHIQLDGHRTSDPLLIALVVQHRLMAGRDTSDGFQAFVYPKGASPGVDEDPFNTFVGFDANRYVFNKLQQTQPDSPLLQEAARFEQLARGTGSH